MKKLSVLFLLLLATFIFVAGCAQKKTPPPPPPVDGEYTDAQELKLRVRELADQMLTTMPSTALSSWVALPVSFVNQQDFQETSALGRYMAEGLIYEFNQRGLPVQEYRLAGNITSDSLRGDFALARKMQTRSQKKTCGALLIGTYLRDKNATFINARLVRATDGLVLRTGQLVLMNTPIIERLSAQMSFEPEPETRGRSRSRRSTTAAAAHPALAASRSAGTPPVGRPVPPPASAPSAAPYPQPNHNGAPVSNQSYHNPNCITEHYGFDPKVPVTALCTGTLDIKNATPEPAPQPRSRRRRHRK